MEEKQEQTESTPNLINLEIEKFRPRIHRYFINLVWDAMAVKVTINAN